MFRFRSFFVAWAIGSVGRPIDALAGMPSPELVFTELGRRRWEEVSLFLVGFLVMAAVSQWLWNLFRRDFPQLPRMTYGRSVLFLLLWGLLMAVVLAMISGARELMTPGAWQANGVTYKLATDPSKPLETAGDSNQERRLRLENLRFALWQFSQTHGGRFPTVDEAKQIPESIWKVDSKSSLQFVYIPGQTANQGDGILVYDPDVIDETGYVLRVNGSIERLNVLSQPLVPSPKTADSAPATPPQAEQPSSVPNGTGGTDQ